MHLLVCDNKSIHCRVSQTPFLIQLLAMKSLFGKTGKCLRQILDFSQLLRVNAYILA
jgi:hypothetical protein